jgi:hypothetical protein
MERSFFNKYYSIAFVTLPGLAGGLALSYARGCPNNLCNHVSRAVIIANRYLQRDYHSLASGGILIGDTLFTLTDMLVKFDHI